MDRRTIKQNRALHKYFEMVATELNEAGLDMRKVLKPGVDIPWNKNLVKEHLWRPVQDLYLGKKSTTELSTKDIDQIFDIINRHLGNVGVHIPFPTEEQLAP